MRPTISILTDFINLVLVLVLVCVKCNDSKTHSQSSSVDINNQTLLNAAADHGSNRKDSSDNNMNSSISLEIQTKTDSDYIQKSQNNVSSIHKNSSILEYERKIHKTESNLPEVPLEGGGASAPFQTSSFNKPIDHVGIDDSEDHAAVNRGSKGRKGVTYPGVSSVVARKGVPEVEDDTKPLSTNHISTKPSVSDNKIEDVVVYDSFTNNQTNSDLVTHTINKNKSNITKSFHMDLPVQGEKMEPITKAHSKKPEYVSDEKDIDYTDKYSLIHTSTTGEDYVIIGIVVVIGIWFSVFGALVFYRRAGEYWDRRHYRRMDFLVEGMYND